MIRIAINQRHKNKQPAGMSKPESDNFWRVFNGQFENVSLTAVDLACYVNLGHAYTTQHRGYRHSKNFICGQHLALDFDTEDERSSLDALAADPFIARFAAFLHTTPSHTAEKPRARAVFILDKAIYDPGEYGELSAALTHRYGGIVDGKCTDPARLFFGSQGCKTVMLGNALPLKTAEIELQEPYRAYLQRQADKQRQGAKTTVSVDSVPDGLLRGKANYLLDLVATAPEGEKYYTLRDMARTFGGYVAGGYYDETAVRSWLEDAIRSNPNNVKSLPDAYRTIRQGIAYGKLDPLFFTVQAPEPETTGPIPCSDWRETAVMLRMGELESLIMALEPADPEWAEAAQEYTDLKEQWPYLEASHQETAVLAIA